jgi:heme exporter protein CcmD
MDQQAFVWAAYAVTLSGLGAMLGLSWRRMRRAERALERERRP